ncbi:MAG: SBBP repeat-containing protein [Anaerolineae bacterium]|nr:SBBP repeat-containing protein [Anaerolineae bacterium]
MHSKSRLLVVSLALLALLANGVGNGVLLQSAAAPLTDTPVSDASVLFIENVGQFHADARFYARVAGRDVWLTQTGLWITTMEDGQTVNLEVRFPDANPSPRLEPFDLRETAREGPRISYFHTPDPRNWHTDIPTWGGVRYVGLYPGVDVEIAGAHGQLIWRMICRAECPTLHVPADDGATTAFHVLGEEFTPLPATADAPLTFQDPPAALIYSSYLGGTGSDGVYAIAAGEDGAAYVTGQTFSTDLPVTPGVVDPDTSGNEAFVAKVAPDGASLVYLTYLGGSDVDVGAGIAVNAEGAAYVGGWTNSADFPVTANAFQPHLNLSGSSPDAFVAVLSPDGTQLRYSTFLGGRNDDRIGYFNESNPIAVGADGAIYVIGTTFSPDFPATVGAFDPTYNQYPDAFVTVFEPDGALRYSTFLGGSDSNDFGVGIAVAADGAAYVVGKTNSVDFPITASAFQSNLHDLYADDGFLTVLTPDGSALRYSTYFGGAGGDDNLYGVVAGSDGVAYVAGTTYAYDLPVTPGVHKPISPNAYSGDAFVAVLDPGRSAAGSLRCATYFGGEADRDQGHDLALNAEGDIYLTGWTRSSDLPTTAGAIQPVIAEYWDAFIAVLSPDCREVHYASYLGGDNGDSGYAVATGPDGNAYVAGVTYSSHFPTTPGAFQPAFGGGSTNGFVARIQIDTLRNITGQVQDDSGNPLAGIVISTNAGHSATTTADGRYTLADLPEGTYTVTPASGYLWAPAAREVTLPPDATGQDFVGRNIVKTVTPVTYQGTLMLGDRLTYTVRLAFPDSAPRSFYDAIPTHTTYVPGSLSAPVGVVYDAEANAIVGPLAFTPGVPFAISFAVQSGIMGTVGFAPQIVNRSCFYPTGETTAACVWSNEVRTFSYVLQVYLPLVVRNAP